MSSLLSSRVQWFPERLSTATQLGEMMTRGPQTTVALCACVERLNRLAHQIEHEGLPATFDWPMLLSSHHRAAVLRVLRHRMAMRSAVGYLN